MGRDVPLQCNDKTTSLLSQNNASRLGGCAGAIVKLRGGAASNPATTPYGFLRVRNDLHSHNAPAGYEGPAAARRGDGAPTPSGGTDSQTVLDAPIVVGARSKVY